MQDFTIASGNGPARADDPRVIRTRNDVLQAALDILLESGWDSVTHANVARASGYSRATIYTHWPDQFSLVRGAFERYELLPHHAGSGDRKADLRGELVSFTRAMSEARLDRALAMLAERAQTTKDVAVIRDSFVTAGERPIRTTLKSTEGTSHEAAVLMLCGMVTHSVLMHAEVPSDELIDEAVRIVLIGLGSTE